jgi:hypothetical protein
MLGLAKLRVSTPASLPTTSPTTLAAGASKRASGGVLQPVKMSANNTLTEKRKERMRTTKAQAKFNDNLISPYFLNRRSRPQFEAPRPYSFWRTSNPNTSGTPRGN